MTQYAYGTVKYGNFFLISTVTKLMVEQRYVLRFNQNNDLNTSYHNSSYKKSNYANFMLPYSQVHIVKC